MRIILLCGIAAMSLSACSTTTKRQEVRDGIEKLEDKREDLRAAERDGSIKDVTEARQDVRDAGKELRADQKELYRPGAEGVAVVALKQGDTDTGNLRALPPEYLNQYRDGDGSYYKYDGVRIYRINTFDRMVTAVYTVGG